MRPIFSDVAGGELTGRARLKNLDVEHLRQLLDAYAGSLGRLLPGVHRHVATLLTYASARREADRFSPGLYSRLKAQSEP